MFARLIHDLTKGRLRLPLRSDSSTTPGDLRVDGRIPRLVSNETTPRDMRLLTDLDLDTPGNPPALQANGMLNPAVIPPATDGSGGGDGLVGEIKLWAGHPLRVPSGWLVCDGSEILIIACPNLFSVIGYQWGRPSNPALYFKLPNLVGRVPIGGPGPNASANGQVHKINVRNPGADYTPGVYTGLTLIADAPASFSTPATVRVTVGASGTVERVDVLTGGVVSNVQPSANPTTGESNCSIRIPITSIPGGAGFTYDVYLAPSTTAQQPWGVRMTNRGAGYTSQPEVIISGPSLVGATAVAVLDPWGDIREVIVTNPGTGDPTGATVTFSGGGPSTPATAVITLWSSPSVPGDFGGEQQHLTLESEMPRHRHDRTDGGTPAVYYPSGPSGRGSDSDIQPRDMPYNGNDRPMNLRPLYAGMLYIIKAV